MTATKAAPTSTDASGFEKPGPGTWTLDTGHFGANSSRICQDLIAEGCTKGSAEGFALMGAPLKQLDAAFVRGRFYIKMTPLVGGGLDLPTPPGPVLWMATRLHPKFRNAEKTAGRALGERFWMDEHKRWVDEWKPKLEQQCRTFSAVDPATLTNDQLASHIDELYALAQFGTALHFRLHVSDLGPIGILLVQARDWGLDSGEIMMTLSGHSPATNAPGEALAAIRHIVAAKGAKPTTLDEVRDLSPEASDLLDAFLGEYGWRLTTGYDIRALTLGEMPATILTAVNAAPSEASAAESNAAALKVGDEAFDALRAKVDPADVAQFDEMVADARALYGLRDENGPLTYQWPTGLLRRAVLETGKRLVSSGRLPGIGADEPHDAIFDLSAAEMASLLRGGDQPALAEIEQRARAREQGMKLDAPTTLGRVEDDPPLWTMPTNLRKFLDAIFTVLEMVENESPALQTKLAAAQADLAHAPKLTGTGVGDEPYVGKACVVHEADEAIANLEPGDILVAPYTVPTYNAVLSIAGAIVSDAGGLLCHAAVIAREYGIAAVVGTGQATSTIPDGATIRVDPTTGYVTVLS